MDKASFTRQDSGIELDEDFEKTNFFNLPAEIRTHIWELVFDESDSHSKAFIRNDAPQHELNDDYYASDHLTPLLTCRQFHADAHLLAFSRTTFVVRNPYTALDLSNRLRTRLRPRQIASLRSIAFVAEARHFRAMRNWKDCAFGLPLLDLDQLSIILHRSSYWHYLFDFNTIVVSLLRNLRGVRRITYIQNRARVKPNFHMWFNRLAGLVLKTDERERFGVCGGRAETTWWDWRFDLETQTGALFALPAKDPEMSFEQYELFKAPLLERLESSMALEEEDADPMSRNGF